VPGPGSTKLAMHLGYRRAGPLGLVVAGFCFILPAMLMVMAIACAYQAAHGMPAFQATLAAILAGVQPVVIAVVVQALVTLGRTALKTRALMVLGALAAIVNFVLGHDLLVLFGTGFVAYLVKRDWKTQAAPSAVAWQLVATVPTASAVTLGGMFLLFLKIGGLIYGSGYVLLPLLHADFVANRGWLTEGQLIDATAIGLVTPGPVFTTATFIGYLLGPAAGVSGPVGAIVATVGIFLPAFVFVALSGPLVPHLRKSPGFSAFLDGVNVAGLALMAVVLIKYLAPAALVDVVSIGVALVATLLLLRYQVNSAWLVATGIGIGLVRVAFFS
jgi:chromate transporter